MRERIYRVWDSRRKEWCYNVDVYQEANFNNEITDIWWTGQWLFENGDKAEFFDNKNPKNILCDYIGKQDSKGVKIFENDIIENENGVDNQRFLVKYNGSACAYKIYWINNGTVTTAESFLFELRGKITIIGNSLQNPELIGEL
ncbi:MAG: YopX family protein [Bacteroidales bacterium]|jgi:uncharacterized phage protein (TIGR01671 family)